ncbi:MotA/TolQ/ExbB proton channel family protein [Vibrio litoralis]|uniref:MotA/TolQ/ExbB proton channel family protein n=1 Tax=Vibrio litoralis TaxID=335972 RepID=UPI00041B2D16|nr:MotA/TolQ/ExbB proton channel family protein [Vibrio litoralis]
MIFISQIEQLLGLMAWPLMICSLLTLIIIVERLIHVIFNHSVGRAQISSPLASIKPSETAKVQHLADIFSQRRAVIYQGVSLLLRQSSLAKPLREDVAGIWLQEKRHQLQSGLKILTLIGVISPLIGLLGTVLGLIDMFKGVAASSGNITPNDLADGLGIAMRTTAAGLIIALPAIVSAQLFTLWSEQLISKLEHAMNRVNLWIEGVDMMPSEKAPSAESRHSTATEAQVVK